jgi:hypothetical protein
MSDIEWKNHTVEELKQAENSRQQGNEGRARVCARRAAGHVAGEYLGRCGMQVDTMNALTRLKVMLTRTELSPQTMSTLEHFLIHTTPEHNLPMEADLIEDVKFLARELLDEDLE